MAEFYVIIAMLPIETFIGPLVIFHTYLIITNWTTIEYLKSRNHGEGFIKSISSRFCPTRSRARDIVKTAGKRPLWGEHDLIKIEPRNMHQSSIWLLDYSGNVSFVAPNVPFQNEPSPVCNWVDQLLNEKNTKEEDPPTEWLFTPEEIKETKTHFSSQVRTEDENKINDSTQFTEPRKRETALAAYRRRSKSRQRKNGANLKSVL